MKHEDKGLILGEYGFPDIDIILQIREETNKVMEYDAYISWGTIQKEKTEARQARNRDIRQVLYQEAEQRTNEVFCTTISAHDNSYMYPAANIEILPTSTQQLI